MKILKRIYVLLFFASTILTSCGGETDTTIVQERTKTQIEVPSEPTPDNTTVHDTSASLVTVRIFFRTRDLSGYEGYDGYEFTKAEIAERENFRIKSNYTYCYDSEEFDNLQLSSSAEKLTLEIREDDHVIFSKSKFDLKDTMKFTTTDFALNMGSTYTIAVSQNDKILFKGKIDSEGCM